MAQNNTFEFVGKLSECKETEKFKPYEEAISDKGWVSKSFKFNMACGTNRHLMVVRGGTWSKEAVDNGKDNSVKTFSKTTYDENNVAIKGESITIPWEKRTKQSEIDKVAEFKKCIVDLEVPNRRYKIEKIIDKFKNNSVTDEQMDELGIHSLEEAEEALKESNAKRKEFIAEWVTKQLR